MLLFKIRRCSYNTKWFTGFTDLSIDMVAGLSHTVTELRKSGSNYLESAALWRETGREQRAGRLPSLTADVASKCY